MNDKKKIDYLEKHIEVLEKENELLKKKNSDLEIALSLEDRGNNKLAENLNYLLHRTEMAKKSYENLITEIQDKKKELDEKIVEYDAINIRHNRQVNELLEHYTSLIK